jgi:glucose-6-phosphate isomerase
VKSFTEKVHRGEIEGQGGTFKNYLLVGIGGSALGPQFVAAALGHPYRDKLKPHFLDNTDPDGIEQVMSSIGNDLARTLCIVISKSGGTRETKNGMLEAKTYYEAAGLHFHKHAVAITQKDSELDKYAAEGHWLEKFPMWDWVGGRTSELSAVGLLPAALQGIAVDALLEGARTCDAATRIADVARNPAAQLALVWLYAGAGRGNKSMVVLPYKDRLALFSKYLQQLIMESIGKEFDRTGKQVNQGITVFGNKGSTDQHSYIQQLRDGQNNFFATFIEVLLDRAADPIYVGERLTSGDYLHGFLLGTREALFQKQRESVTITLSDVSPFRIGALIALFERSVGLYASLINVNAYNQPGVEAGKKAAVAALALQSKIMTAIADANGAAMTAEAIAASIDAEDDVEHVFKICERLASNPGRCVIKLPGGLTTDSRYKSA